MTSGIYKIVTGRRQCYIGSSENVERRLAQHLRWLRRNTHPNPKLQASFNKHGVSCAVIVKEVCVSKLLTAEQNLLDTLRPTLNQSLIAGRVQHTPEVRRKMAYWRGKKLPAEMCAKMSESRRGRLVWNSGLTGVKCGLAAASQSVRDAQSKRMKGNKIWVGRKHSAETLAKMSAAAKARIRIWD